MTGGRLSLAPEDGLLGTHAIDGGPWVQPAGKRDYRVIA
jgi:hypothetical protein